MQNLLTVLSDLMQNVTEPFTSETDFQFWLAWELKSKMPHATILLEYPSNEEDSKRKYYDIAVKDKKSISFIELKYKTRKAPIRRYEIPLELKEQGARDIGNYLFLKDVERMENTAIKGNKRNFCIMLTNDHLYWNPSNRKTLDDDFKLVKTKRGILKWRNVPQKSRNHWTKEYPSIKLSRTYLCRWNELKIQNILFKYLLLEITTK